MIPNVHEKVDSHPELQLWDHLNLNPIASHHALSEGCPAVPAAAYVLMPFPTLMCDPSDTSLSCRPAAVRNAVVDDGRLPCDCRPWPECPDEVSGSHVDDLKRFPQLRMHDGGLLRHARWTGGTDMQSTDKPPRPRTQKIRPRSSSSSVLTAPSPLTCPSTALRSPGSVVHCTASRASQPRAACICSRLHTSSRHCSAGTWSRRPSQPLSVPFPSQPRFYSRRLWLFPSPTTALTECGTWCGILVVASPTRRSSSPAGLWSASALLARWRLLSCDLTSYL